MRCNVCLAPLMKVGHRIREYRDVNGRVYKKIAWPRYAPCRNLDNPEKHPARARVIRPAQSSDQTTINQRKAL